MKPTDRAVVSRTKIMGAEKEETRGINEIGNEGAGQCSMGICLEAGLMRPFFHSPPPRVNYRVGDTQGRGHVPQVRVPN